MYRDRYTGFSYPQSPAGCKTEYHGVDNADSPERWQEKSRSTLSLASQVDASARLQIDADSLLTALAAHTLIRPLPSAAALAERVRLRERKRGATDDTRGNSE